MFRPESSGRFLLSGISLFWEHAHQREHMDDLSYNKGVILIRAVRWLTSGKITATYIPWGSHSPRPTMPGSFLHIPRAFLPACQEPSSWPTFRYFGASKYHSSLLSSHTILHLLACSLRRGRAQQSLGRLFRASENNAPSNWQFSDKQTDPCLHLAFDNY